ncbi:MAG TPA: SAM-dependent methyltransferase [Myxococcota bacterium]|nr:SAM-dependent methyltransferase [Myxococcota bacterium]
MVEGRPSRTAEYMALFRALETRLPADRRLFVDPFARRFLSPRLRFAVDLARLPGVARAECRLIDARWPGVRTSAAARTRFIDERLIEAVRRGAGQVVILGAGFDARAYRLAALRDCAVFEVDHPATQERKLRLLGPVAPTSSRRVRFVATDFAAGQLEAAMASQGYDAARPSLVIWEGVSNYLTEGAVDETLRWCAKGAVGSELVFTYVHAKVLREPGAFFGTAALLRTLEAAGERWTFGLDPARAPEYLRARGLELLDDVPASEYRARCYGPAAAGMKGYEFYRIARARVA